MSLPRELTPVAVKALLDGERAARPVLLDVRNPDEHAICALPGAVLLPLPELPERAFELEAYRERTIVVYCHHGVRSLSGAAFLSSLGFLTTSLRGGIEAWSRDVDPSVPTY